MSDIKEERNGAFSMKVSDAFIVESVFIIISLTVLVFFRHQSIYSLFTRGHSILNQLGIGSLIAILLFIPVSSYLWKKKDLLETVSYLEPVCSSSILIIIGVGLSAGIGEEVFFRATLQPLVGIWIASVVFVLAHAKMWASRPFTFGKKIFVILAFSCSLLLGFMYEQQGLISSITIHSLFDIGMLLVIKSQLKHKHNS